MLNSPLRSQDPSTPVSLGRSSLKRRQADGVNDTPNEESPLAKRSRAAVQDDQSYWDEFFASLRTSGNFAVPMNEPMQSTVAMGEGSTSRASSRSPPPPPPPPDSPPTTRSIQTPSLPPQSIKSESPVTLSMQVDNPIHEATQQTNSTPITQQTIDTSPGKEIRQYKLAIIAMHQKNYTTGDIQRAFREYLELEISKEMIKDIIEQSDATSQLSMEQEKSASSTEIQKHPTRPSVIETDNPLEQQGLTGFPSDTKDVHDFPAQTEPINEQVMQQEETSASTAAENTGQVLNGLAISEPINSTALRSRSRSTRLTSPPSEPPFQIVPRPQSPSGVLASGLLSSLNTLSPEEALSQLEALHASLPSLLDRHRQIVREIEEEKERKRREEEEQALAAEIAEQERLLEENTRELMKRERAIKEKNEQLAKLREKLRRRQTSAMGTRYSPRLMMVINSSSKGSTPVSENKMSQLENGPLEESQQKQSMAIEAMQASTETAQTENANNMPSSNVSSEVSVQVLEDMVLESPHEMTIAMESDTENAKALIESPIDNGSRETSMETVLTGKDIPIKPITIEEPIVEETTKEEMVTEEPEVEPIMEEPMETEEEPFSMIQVASPEVMDKTDQTDIQVVGLGMETGIQVVGSGGMTFSLPDYTSDNESGQSNDMHIDIPLQDRIRHDDEMVVDERQTLSTRDSRSPSFERQHSPFQWNISEDRPRGRRVTFTDLTDDTKVTFPPQRVSVSVEKTTRFGQGDDVEGDHSPSMSLGARISTPPYDPVQTYSVSPPVHRLKLSESSTTLVTNKFRDWSDYFVALDHDGNIDLLDSKKHCSVGSPPLLWKQEYTATAAINGAWIAPWELALVHADSRRNRGETEVTLVKYIRRAGSRWIKPRVTHLNPCPHGYNEKITAVESLWEENDGKRVFATGGNCIFAMYEVI